MYSTPDKWASCRALSSFSLETNIDFSLFKEYLSESNNKLFYNIVFGEDLYTETISNYDNKIFFTFIKTNTKETDYMWYFEGQMDSFKKFYKQVKK